MPGGGVVLVGEFLVIAAVEFAPDLPVAFAEDQGESFGNVDFGAAVVLPNLVGGFETDLAGFFGVDAAG